MPLVYIDGAQVDASGTTPLTLSPMIPAGTAAGDTLVAFAAGDLRSSSGSISMGTPSGWTSIGSQPTGVSWLTFNTGSPNSNILQTSVTDTSADIDIRALCRRASWLGSSSGSNFLVSDLSSQFNWIVNASSTGFRFTIRSGASVYNATATPATMGLIDGEWAWVRFTYSTAARAQFWTSADGVSWTLVQTSNLTGATTLSYAIGSREINVGAVNTGSGLGFGGDIAALRVSSSTSSLIADLGLAGLTSPGAAAWTSPLGTSWSTLGSPKSWVSNGAGAIFAFLRTATSGDAGTSAAFTFPAAYGAAGLSRSVRLLRFSGYTSGPGDVMTDRRGFQVSASTWQPAAITAAGTLGTFALAEYRNGTPEASPIVTANGWTLDSGTLASNSAATLRQQNVAAPSSPVLVASAGVRAALGVGFGTTSADEWGVDRIAW